MRQQQQQTAFIREFATKKQTKTKNEPMYFEDL